VHEISSTFRPEASTGSSRVPFLGNDLPRSLSCPFTLPRSCVVDLLRALQDGKFSCDCQLAFPCTHTGTWKR